MESVRIALRKWRANLTTQGQNKELMYEIETKLIYGIVALAAIYVSAHLIYWIGIGCPFKQVVP